MLFVGLLCEQDDECRGQAGFAVKRGICENALLGQDLFQLLSVLSVFGNTGYPVFLDLMWISPFSLTGKGNLGQLESAWNLTKVV